jgi:hypothetical protein
MRDTVPVNREDLGYVLGFVLGWWPGYEDAVHWSDDMKKEAHEFYMAAQRIYDKLHQEDEHE